ncbi:RagB/SusD family nutrient uptake outer membrane protein [Dysgonomonas sp. GY75]|uniref:RagB/SusD family nutrient uptake outer membrane protein n=1 Tax=Dysgonomonas sp. GY75 TaxID=2780419 RepID=UPI0018846B8C|nr:RagB/SusD family nutrient uptake outer membrane protein [Dysgonomonas sp. GY75]MBF0648217.1 RagB/SusD family nutrient uptake outer membrane protein [Dysgonomonas sp. GY75]
MKKNILLIISCLIFLSSCDFLEVKSEDKLPGDEFWIKGNDANAEGFLMSVYFNFRKATMGSGLFLTASGDMRCAPIIPFNGSGQDKKVDFLVANKMNDLRTYSYSPFGETTKWKPFYDVIQSANILINEIDKVPDISEDKRLMFKAEAVFMRNISYFFLVRAFGDVPYYTKAYNSASLPRMDMVTVLLNCLEDLKTGALNSDLLPWTYSSNAKKGVRASRGSVLALMMHINLWLVQFDDKNKNTYYQNVVALGEQLESNGGAYELVEMSRISTVFTGGSNEGLFEIAQNINSSGEVFSKLAVFSNNVAYSHTNEKKTVYYYDSNYMEKIFPYSEIDLRKQYWFDENMYIASTLTPTEIKKFLNVDYYSDSERTSNSGNQMVFRYSDALLLYAEALAALGNDGPAYELLKRVRDRAGASTNSLSGKDLQDAIFWERQRELIGEGHYYYDLVRTGKISNYMYCEHPIRRTEFNVGAWTWPIHRDALSNNTNIQLNLYWE